MGFLSLLSSIILSGSLHVGQLAEYEYSLVNGRIQLEVTLEYSEMKHLNLNNECDIDKMTALCLSNYVLEHSMLEINNEVMNFELTESYVVDDHLILIHSSTNNVEVVTSIEVKNTSFYELFDAYRNRMIINLGTFSGSYMLTKEKNSIRLTL